MSDLVSQELEQAIGVLSDAQVESVTAFTKRVVPEEEVTEILAMLGISDDVEVFSNTNDYGMRRKGKS